MCGIVGMVGERESSPILIEGLKRLEYRGYDSAGIAVIDKNRSISCTKVLGKVEILASALQNSPCNGGTGIAHTRWATHGKPSELNAHPHLMKESLALVHNGIIENHQELKEALVSEGYTFRSQTDSEVLAGLITRSLDQGKSLLGAVSENVRKLEGAYTFCVISKLEKDTLIVARQGSPAVIGLGIGENFVASDVFALLPVTQRFIFLNDGDIAVVTKEDVSVFDVDGNTVERKERISESTAEISEKDGYRHYMLKEIFEQPKAVNAALDSQLGDELSISDTITAQEEEFLKSVEAVTIVACGTSYHAGLVAKYWIEELAGVPCSVEVASEFRYRLPAILPKTLFIAISQSGETADSLAGLRAALDLDYLNHLAICNVAESSLTRESGMTILTKAGPEIGVASTKAFTTQLASLLVLAVKLAVLKHGESDGLSTIFSEIKLLPGKIDTILALDHQIAELADSFLNDEHALFLGRGTMYPIAMEGALKLKEISYIHAEAYPAGELKHGPLALIDEKMPVVVVAPNDRVVDKLRSNLEEVKARGGRFIIFSDSGLGDWEDLDMIRMPSVPEVLAPICYTIPLQLCAYHVAVLKGSDVDQPRNLAKSVTVD
ncbi:MAG: glutamine--fructose-6-phosphate transaminase (isomerizing) [Pseudomonadota bacterium]|nr:glutamine--fructose-6-phosphate transaminase (isomerizing) [Pseudomonadota bacterium]